jgi:peptide/nickel transport system substrate-binding protein
MPSLTQKIAVAVLVVLILATGGFYFFVYQPRGGAYLSIPNETTMVEEVIGEPDSLDPAIDYETAGGEIILNVYETLIWYKGTSTTEYEPLLATEVPSVANGGISADGKTYTFKIRQGVKFHDGTSLNAYAVKYSIDRAVVMSDPSGPAWMLQGGGVPILGAADYAASAMTPEDATTYRNAGGVKVIDEYTVQINLEYAYAPTLSVFAYTVCAIVSPTAVEAHAGIAPGQQNNWMRENAVGTGPFKLVEWTPKQRIVLERNDNYWRTAAKLKRVIIKQVAETATRELDLFTGDADIVYIPTTNAYDVIDQSTWQTYREVRSIKPGVRVIAGKPTYTIMQIQMNTAIPPFDNKDFRYGMSYIFDYKTFVDQAINGFGVQGKGPVPEGMFGHDTSLFQFTYDATKAKTYFQKAGWTGKLTVYYNAGNEVRKRGCLLLKDAIERLNIGITVEVQELDWPTFLAKQRKKELPIFFIGWAPDYADADDYVIPYCHSTMGTYAARIGYKNGTIDSLISRAARSTDPTERLSLYKEIQREIVEDAVYIWTYQATNFHVERTWVKGWYYNPMVSSSGQYFYVLSKEW